MNRSSVFKVVIVLLCCASLAFAKKKDKKMEPSNDFKDITVEQFSDPLKSVIEASRHDFGPIKGEFDLLGAGNNRWNTSISLPGAVSCRLVKALAQVIRDVSFPENFFYSCEFWKRGSYGDVLDQYVRLVGFVTQITNWKYNPAPWSEGQRHTVFFKSGPEDPTIMVSVSPDAASCCDTALSLSVNPFVKSTKLNSTSPSTGTGFPSSIGVPTPESPETSVTQIRQEMEKIRSGAYAPMPQAQRSLGGGSDVLGGRTVMTVKNSTQYALSVYFDGPVTSSLNLQPGASQTIDLAPGTFHVAGRAVAGNVLPYYGDDTYVGSAEYNLTFYIQ